MIEKKEKNICSQCGLCRESCEFFKIIRHETVSPRGKVILKEGKNWSDVFYQHCTVCRACEIACPLGYKLETEKVRAKMVKAGLETKANQEMIKNVRQYGNPFGKIKKGEIPDKLYCC